MTSLILADSVCDPLEHNTRVANWYLVRFN